MAATAPQKNSPIKPRPQIQKNQTIDPAQLQRGRVSLGDEPEIATPEEEPQGLLPEDEGLEELPGLYVPEGMEDFYSTQNKQQVREKKRPAPMEPTTTGADQLMPQEEETPYGADYNQFQEDQADQDEADEAEQDDGGEDQETGDDESGEADDDETADEDSNDDQEQDSAPEEAEQESEGEPESNPAQQQSDKRKKLMRLLKMGSCCCSCLASSWWIIILLIIILLATGNIG